MRKRKNPLRGLGAAFCKRGQACRGDTRERGKAICEDEGRSRRGLNDAGDDEVDFVSVKVASRGTPSVGYEKIEEVTLTFPGTLCARRIMQ